MQVLDELFGLSGKAALVTGAAGGIGRACAEMLAKAGATVACTTDKNMEGLEETVKGIEASGGRAIAVRLDVADEASVVTGMAEAVKKLGHLDILINNAGIFPPFMMESTDTELWDRVFAVNVRGTWLCMREAIKPLRESGAGAIINISSVDAFMATIAGVGLYGTTKASQIQMTRNAAIEFAPTVTVNAICPGPVHTPGLGPVLDMGFADVLLPRIPLGRIGKSEDVGAAVLALVGPGMRYVTGTFLVVDGGYLQT